VRILSFLLEWLFLVFYSCILIDLNVTIGEFLRMDLVMFRVRLF